VGGQGAVGKGR
jgi:hypothetical protein